MYQLTDTSSILRLSDGAFIPADPANSDYAAYLRWAAAGNEALPYVPPAPPVPTVVSRFQALAALHLAGVLPHVESLMSAPEADFLVKLAWQNAQEFHRNSPMVLALSGALGLSTEQLDALFTTAAGIVA
jgi:hypothetical protein